MKSKRFPSNGVRVGRRQQGVAMVEFAIGAPVLLLLLLAIGEFGRMLYHYNVLLQSSRDAARYASRHAMDRTLNRIDFSRVVPGGDVECGVDRSVYSYTRNLAIYGVPCWQGSTPPALVPFFDESVDSVGVEVACGSACDHVRVTIRYAFHPLIGGALPGFFGSSVPLGVELVATTVMRAL